MLKRYLIVAVLAASALTVPAVLAADSPEGLKCPIKTADGKWMENTNVTNTIDCVPKSIAG